MKMYNRLGKNQKAIVEKIREQSINLKHCTDKKLYTCIFANPLDNEISKLCNSVHGAKFVYSNYKRNNFGYLYPYQCIVIGENKILKKIEIL